MKPLALASFFCFLTAACAMKPESPREPAAACGSGLTLETLAQSPYFAGKDTFRFRSVLVSKSCDSLVVSDARYPGLTGLAIHVLVEKKTGLAPEGALFFDENQKYEKAIVEILKEKGFSPDSRNVSIFRGGEINVGSRRFYMDQYVLINRATPWNNASAAQNVVSRLLAL